MKGINLFLAYAPEDKEYREKIGKHLSVLKERGFLNEFCLSEVQPGANADLEIRTMMNQAKIILLLISADFLASEECQRLEDLAFSMKMRNDAVVVPVLLRPCLYDESYDQLEMLPGDNKSISDTSAWDSEDAALTRVAERIKDLVVKIREEEAAKLAAATPVATPPPPPPVQPLATVDVPPATPTPGFSYKKILLPLILVLGFGFLGGYLFFNQPAKKGTATIVKEKDPIEAKTKFSKAPDFIKQDWAVVAKKLQLAGIKNVTRSTKMSCNIKPGTVIAQSPKAGEKVDENTKFELKLASAPRKIKPASVGNKNVKTLKNGQRTRQAAWAFKNTNVIFSVGGTECSKGKITVDHPLGGTKVHSLKAGTKGTNSRFFGLGDITVTFSSSDPAAFLKVSIY